MKHQISKVALIATLAFIGVGFAGTQQAKATDCPKDNCYYWGSRECYGYFNYAGERDEANGCVEKVLNPTSWKDQVDSLSSCLDCDGAANGPNKSCTKYCVKFRTVYYTCQDWLVCEDEWDDWDNRVAKKAGKSTVYDKFVHQTSGNCTNYGCNMAGPYPQ